MRTRPKFLMVTIVLLIWAFSFAGSGRAHSLRLQKPADALTPENTVILANRTDARFSQDFSVLLKSLRLEWAVVDSDTVPDAVQDKHLIILGRLDAAFTGEIMRSILTAEELETIRAAGEQHVVLTKASPWAENRSVYICTRADLLLTRNAAEEAVRAIVAGSPPTSDWIVSRFDAPLDEGMPEAVDPLLWGGINLLRARKASVETVA